MGLWIGAASVRICHLPSTGLSSTPALGRLEACLRPQTWLTLESELEAELHWVAPGCCCAGSRDNTVRVWDLTTLTCITTLTGHCDDVVALAISEWEWQSMEEAHITIETRALAL